MSRIVRVDEKAAAVLAAVHAKAFDRPWSSGDIADMIANLGAICLAAGAGSELQGFILFQSAGGEAEVLILAVLPEARRRGMGLRLIEAAAAEATRAGATTFWLEVAADNAAALALYDRAGFEAQGRRRGYYRTAAGGRTDAIVMRRALNTAVSSLYSP